MPETGKKSNLTALVFDKCVCGGFPKFHFRAGFFMAQCGYCAMDVYMVGAPFEKVEFKAALNFSVSAWNTKVKKKKKRNEKHLERIRQVQCCVCFSLPKSDPHHLKQGTNERGMGLRSSDCFVVPLCRSCHDEVENVGSKNETEWFQNNGISDPLGFAKMLWNCKSVEEMKITVQQLIWMY